ncbi:terminase large subunit [Lachnospiraceae bacterium LCP25S3_G4]
MIEFEKYFTDLLDNKITACDKMKRVSNILLEQYSNPNEFHFDLEIAKRHTDFIEKFCKQPSGRLGTPLKLELFQKARLQALFGFVDDNDIRQYNECLIVEGRKNGKTTETAAVECNMLVNDREGSPQIYNIATMLDQAKLGFNACHKMVQQSPMLSKHIKKRASDLYFKANFGYIKALASNSNSLDGLDVHCAVIDELAAIKNRDIYDLIKQAMGARSQPLLFCITTNGFIREGIFDKQYEYARNILEGKAENRRFLPFIYELDNPKEWDNEKYWIKANPGLGTIKSVDYLRQMVDKAKDDPSFKPTVMVKDFNIPQTSETAWLRFEDLKNETKLVDALLDYKFDYAIGSFDAADTTDLNSAKVLCMRPGDVRIYVKSMYWIPQEVIDLQEIKGDRRERDSVPYSLWKTQGWLRTCQGNKCDKRIFLEWFKELRDEEDLYVNFIFFDPWHIDDSLLREFKSEFGKNSMIPVRQGVMSLSQPMKDLAAEFKAHNVIYDNNPIDRWCLYNTQAKTDVNGNIQPVKELDSRKRIDGAVTFIMGYKGLQDKKDVYINLNREVEN